MDIPAPDHGHRRADHGLDHGHVSACSTTTRCPASSRASRSRSAAAWGASRRTGAGVLAMIAQEACRSRGMSIWQGATVAVQGFGNVGSASRRGCFTRPARKVVAVSDAPRRPLQRGRPRHSDALRNIGRPAGRFGRALPASTHRDDHQRRNCWSCRSTS